MNYEINTTYLYSQFGENHSARRKAFDSFLNNTRVNWISVASLMEHGQFSQAAEKLMALNPSVKLAGFGDLAREIVQFSQAIRMNLLGPEAARVRYESINLEIAIARSLVKTELDCL